MAKWKFFASAISLNIVFGVTAVASQAQEGPLQSADASEMPGCLDWARTRPASEDRRLIDVFNNPRLGGVYETLNRENPPIVAGRELGYPSTSYVINLHDVPKDEFETTEEYLQRRQAVWEDIVGRDARSLTIGHERLDFTYSADQHAMTVQVPFAEISSPSDDYPPAIRFSNTFVNLGSSSLSNDYYISASSGFFRRFVSDSGRDIAPLVIPMDGAAARDLNSSGILRLRFRSPVFRSNRLPAAFRRGVFLEHLRHTGNWNVIYANLECAVLATAGGAYYDLLEEESVDLQQIGQPSRGSGSEVALSRQPALTQLDQRMEPPQAPFTPEPDTASVESGQIWVGFEFSSMIRMARQKIRGNFRELNLFLAGLGSEFQGITGPFSTREVAAETLQALRQEGFEVFIYESAEGERITPVE